MKNIVKISMLTVILSLTSCSHWSHCESCCDTQCTMKKENSKNCDQCSMKNEIKTENTTKK